MKILITGSTGQLARELQVELAGTGKLLALGHNGNLTNHDALTERAVELGEVAARAIWVLLDA